MTKKLESDYLLFDPNSVENYFGYLEYCSIQRIKKMSSVLERCSEYIPQKSVVCTCGSDGRYERSAPGKTNLYIITENEESFDGDSVETILESIIDSDLALESAVEIKTLSGDTESLFSHNQRAWPDIILDAAPVLGNKQILSQARQITAKYLVSPMSYSLIRSLNHRRKSFRKASNTGKYSGQGLFNLDDGVVNFCRDEENHLFGIKSSGLRLIQTSILLTFIQLARYQQDPSYIISLPSSTREKLNFVEKFFNLDPDITSQTSTAYGYFIWLHNFHQQTFNHFFEDLSWYEQEIKTPIEPQHFSKGQVGPLEFEINPQEFKTHLKILLDYDAYLSQIRHHYFG